jgi:hypothetical protein
LNVPSLGIDIGGTSVKAALVDQDKLHTARSFEYQLPDREQLKRAVREAVDQLAQHGCALDSVGLCLPGRQDEACTRVVESVNLPCLDGWVFDELLEDCLGFAPSSYRVVSDIYATGFDLIRSHELVGRVAVFAIGTGVGLMIFDDGVPVKSKQYQGFGQRFRFEDKPLEDCIGVRPLRFFAESCDERKVDSFVRACPAGHEFLRAVMGAVEWIAAQAKPDVVLFAGGVGLAIESRRDELGAAAGCEIGFGSSLYHAASGAALLALG